MHARICLLEGLIRSSRIHGSREWQTQYRPELEKALAASGEGGLLGVSIGEKSPIVCAASAAGQPVQRRSTAKEKSSCSSEA
jgi:hypothetical protein